MTSATTYDRGRAALAWAVVLTLTADRLLVQTGVGGGSGLLRLAWVATCVIGVLCFTMHRDAWDTFARIGSDAMPFLTFLAIGCMLPILGVIADFPMRTLMAIVTPLASLMVALIAATVARERPTGLPWAHGRALAVVGWLALTAGACQFAYYRLDVTALEPLLLWDQAQTVASGATLIVGRATGIYFNPNTYALLGGTLLIAALALELRASQRVAVLVPALGILLLSQSRGVLVALAVTALVELVRRSRHVRLHPRTPALIALVVAIVAAATILLAQQAPAFLASLSNRLGSIVDVIAGGTAASADLAARVGFWQTGWEILLERPLGTFGGPELLLGTAVDSDLIRITLQGGILYLGIFVWMLVWMARVPSSSPWAALLRALAPFLAVVAITQVPTATAVFPGLVALAVGLHVGWAAGEPAGSRPAHRLYR